MKRKSLILDRKHNPSKVIQINGKGKKLYIKGETKRKNR